LRRYETGAFPLEIADFIRLELAMIRRSPGLRPAVVCALATVCALAVAVVPVSVSADRVPVSAPVYLLAEPVTEPTTTAAHPALPFSVLADPGDEQGAALSAAGDVNRDGLSDLILSSPGHATGRGLVQVYLGAVGGGFTLNVSITSAALNSRFGESVCTAGDVNDDGYDDILVGWPLINSGAGQVNVYLGSPTGIAGGPIAQIPGPVAGGQFGAAVAFAGNLNNDDFGDIAVGAPLATPSGGATECGAMYVFYGNPSGVTVPPSPSAFRGSGLHQRRGTSLAGVGDVNADTYDDLLVGAPFTQADGVVGKVFLYRGSSTGITSAAVDSVPGSTAGARFGFSVCSAGDWDADGYMDVAVGAPFAGPIVEGGAAFLIKGTAAGLPNSVTTLKTGTLGAGHLGWSVGCAGDVNGDGFGDVIIGEPGYDGPAGVDEGRIHVRYGLRSGTALTDFVVSSGAGGSKFGQAVSGIGDATGDGFGDLAVGAPAASSNAGALYVFQGGVATGARLTQFVYGHSIANARIGQSVSSGGDFNGDGYDDAIAGAPGDEWLMPLDGAAYVAWGAANSATSPTLFLILHGPQSSARFGASAAIAGDVDGDGYDDAIVGAPAYLNTLANQGAAFWYRGQPAGLDTIPAEEWLGASTGQEWGTTVAGAGDLNHDGYADVAIGSPMDGSLGPVHAGKVAIYFGGPSGPSTTPAFEVYGQTAGESLGVAIEPAGDVTGDGIDDLAIGAPGWSSSVGRVRIVQGSYSAPFHVFTIASPFGFPGHFGAAIAGRGDVNGDGIADLAVGAPQAVSGGNQVGGVAIFRGQVGGPAGPPAQTLFGVLQLDEFGAGVGFGDLSSDGYSDLAVGIPGADGSLSNSGAVDLYLADVFGNFSSPPTRLTRTSTAIQGRGATVAIDGDFNGDGFADVIAGGPTANTLASGGGELEFAYGGGSLSARDHVERQLQWLTTTPLALAGRSNTGDSFDVVMRARIPVGREEMTVQHQKGTTIQTWASLPVNPSVTGIPAAPDPTNGCYMDVGQGMNGFLAGDVAKWRMRVRTRFPWIPSTPWWSPSGVASTLKHVLMPPSLVAVGPGGPGALPAVLELAPAAPNPSRDDVVFAYRLPSAASVRCAIFDPKGRLVRDLSPGVRPAGEGRLRWDGRDAAGRTVAGGLYFVRVEAGKIHLARSFVRL
jgi:hypothetical protein